jgi:hypothetical protein
MKILHLTLKKKWFDMIASGQKNEEYREMKPYWSKRLIGIDYDVVRFRNGYSLSSPVVTLEYKGLLAGLGVTQWGAPVGETVYILRLGKIVPN